MNNFEKRLFLDYLNKLTDVLNVDNYNFDGVFDFFIKEFNVSRSRFPWYQDDTFNSELQFKNRSEKNEFKKTFNKVVKELQKKITPKSTSLEKKLLLIKEIYKLNSDEYNLFIYFLIQQINNIFTEFFDDCIKNDSLSTFCRNYLGIRTHRMERILNQLHLNKILLSKRRGSSNEVNQDIIKVFDEPYYNTKERIIGLLLGKKEVSDLTLNDFKHLDTERKKVVDILKSAVKTKRKGVNILLYGAVGTGKTQFAKLIANTAKIPLYPVKTEEENLEEANRETRLIDLYSKQHLLSVSDKSCILFDEAEDVMNRGFSPTFGNASKGYLNKILEETPVPVIWTTNNIEDVDPAFLRRMTFAIEFEKLTDDVRLNIWNKILKKNNLKVQQSKIEELNKTYDISPSIIANAVQTTKMIGGTEDDFEGFIENVAKIVDKKKNVKIIKAEEFDPKKYDINLVNSDLDVNNLTEQIKKCGKLNFSICMYGEPGTGKSHFARYLANELGIKVIQKRTSDLLSMWVGGSEKNIAEAFREAKEEKAMLIFDEADSLLQNRSNAQRSWEITQVNEMLTWMESHQYPFICTTNLLDTLDEASLRRFTFKIKFDFMNSKQVNRAMKHFFNLDTDLNIKGLTTGDFATVKKKADFLEIRDVEELSKMLESEVKIKKSNSLKNAVGF